MMITYWNDEVEVRFREWDSDTKRPWNRSPQLTMPLPAIAPAMPENQAGEGQIAVTKVGASKTMGRPPKSLSLEGIPTGLSLRKTAKLIGGVSYGTVYRARRRLEGK